MNTRILKLITAIAAVLFTATTAAAQEKTMSVMRKGTVIYQSTVASVDSIIFSDPSPTSLDAGIVIDGTRWATRNVAAPGVFAENPEDVGMFYQWNSKTGWSATNPMINSEGGTEWIYPWNGNNAASWEKINDPCPPGWRMPTQAELKKLSDSGGVSATVNGVNGRQFGALFLPAVGKRDYDDGWLYLRGTVSEGYYWSNTVRGSDSYYLEFSSDFISSYVLYSNRGYGYSCRCVLER
jgi:uncharacterized protein (TIGR02145 family)